MKLIARTWWSVIALGVLSIILGSCRDLPLKPDESGASRAQPFFSNGSGAGNTYHYVTAQGGFTVGNGATPDSAWTFDHALAGAAGHLTGGDTVWLMAGTYTGTYSATLSAGSSGSPVVFRQIRGGAAKLVQNGGFGQTTTPSLTVEPQARWTEFWDFEITNTSTQQRSDSSGTSHEWVPHAIWNKAPHTKFVNLVIHDVGHAFLNEPDAADVTISGCIIYNNGWQRPDPPGTLASIDGHGLYLRNNSTVDSVVASDNVIFNQFGYGIHVYTNAGEGALNSIVLRGNVAFNNGSMTRFGTNANLGNLGEPLAVNQTFELNRLFFSTETALNAAPNNSQQLTIGRNLAYGASSSGTSTRNANYIIGGNPIVQGGTGWVTSAADVTSSVPFQDTVLFRVTKADSRRANIVVYSSTGMSTVQVNVAGFLNNGDHYIVRNAQKLGTIIKDEVYNGSGSISFSNTSVTAPPSMGQPSLRQPVVTGPGFNVFVLTNSVFPATPILAFRRCTGFAGTAEVTATTNTGGTTLTVQRSPHGQNAWVTIGTYVNDPAGAQHILIFGTPGAQDIQAWSTANPGANPLVSPVRLLGPVDC